MKKITIQISLILLYLICYSFNAISQPVHTPRANDYTINLTRMFAKEVFDLNGTAYLQPLVSALNATSNCGFFNQAFIPKSVDKPYFRLSVVSMSGFVSAAQKSFVPKFPNEALDPNKLLQLVKVDFLTDPLHPKVIGIPDTAALLLYALKVYSNQGIKTGVITPPNSSATILGNQRGYLYFPKSALDSLIRNYPQIGNQSLYNLLPDSMKNVLTKSISQFPEQFALPPGANLNSLSAFVPQLEIGSLWGTELLIRLIPPVYLGQNIGKFAFWGLGIKHSISQYFENPPFDFAIQGVGQGTSLKNSIGITNAQLTANAVIWDINIQASKSFFDNMLTIYTGLTHDWFFINSSYKYYLPVETQSQLGLVDNEIIGYLPDNSPILRPMAPQPPQYPGDTVAQYSNIKLKDKDFKWVIGVMGSYGPISLSLDFNYSKFIIISGGIAYTF